MDGSEDWEEDDVLEPSRTNMAWGGESENEKPYFLDDPCSTPTDGRDSFPVLNFTPSPIADPDVFDLELDDSDVNPGWAAGRIIYSSEEDISLPDKPTTTCLGRWSPRPVEVNKYVDDNLQEEAVNFENVQPVMGVKDKHAIATQNVFRHIVRQAEMKGMKVNSKKTNMICIADSLNFKTKSHIFDREGEKIESGEHLKVLGWHFSDSPTVEAHIKVLVRRFRERYWTLRHLRHNGFGADDLIKVYKAVLRPVAEYMLEVFHSMLNDAQDESLERLQCHALKCIFGPGISGRRMREMAGLETL